MVICYNLTNCTYLFINVQWNLWVAYVQPLILELWAPILKVSSLFSVLVFPILESSFLLAHRAFPFPRLARGGCRLRRPRTWFERAIKCIFHYEIGTSGSSPTLSSPPPRFARAFKAVWSGNYNAILIMNSLIELNVLARVFYFIPPFLDTLLVKYLYCRDVLNFPVPCSAHTTIVFETNLLLRHVHLILINCPRDIF